MDIGPAAINLEQHFELMFTSALMRPLQMKHQFGKKPDFFIILTIANSSSSRSCSSSSSRNTRLPPNPIIAVGCIHHGGLQPALI